MIELTIHLADGTDYSFQLARTPKNWKSWLMRQVPVYMHVMQGCTFSKTRVA